MGLNRPFWGFSDGALRQKAVKTIQKPQTRYDWGLDGGNPIPKPPNPDSGWRKSAPTPQIRGSFWGRDGAILNPDHLGSHAGVLLLSIPPWLQAQLPVGPRCPSLGQPPGVDADAAQHLLNEVTQLRGDDEDVGGDGQRGEAGEALVVHIHLLCRGVQGVEAALRQDVLEDPCEPIRGPRGAADLLGAHMEEEVGGGEAQHDPIDVQGAGIWHEVHPRFVLLGQLRADEGGLGVHEVVVGVPL